MRILPLILALCASPACAAPAKYTLQPEASLVGFETDFGSDKISGEMPITRADLTLDFKNVSASHVAVTLDAAHADASFPFAAQAMKGPKVLDSADFPQISFESTSVSSKGEGAEVKGQVTIRGVTKPMVMQAMIWRQKGHDAGDLSHLTIRLTGAVNRSDFGAVGWSDMVGDQVRLDILARIARSD
ncbi:MAG: YceI family protein [Pseudomonadota bacterium]